jgi:hypothetical protein
MQLNINVQAISGLPEAEKIKFQKLLQIYQKHAGKNAEKDKYYEGKISLSEVNLGIALPIGMAGLEIGCSWGSKTVDVLAARSMFDGFVSENGTDIEELDQIVEDNNLIAEYMKATRDELKYGCTFATLSADDKIGVKIRFHSPQTACALWNGEKNRIECGFAIIDTVPDNESNMIWNPHIINYYTDDAIYVLTENNGLWYSQAYPHRMGRPLMEALNCNATSDKPFGRSRIKEPVRRLIQGYVCECIWCCRSTWKASPRPLVFL